MFLLLSKILEQVRRINSAHEAALFIEEFPDFGAALLNNFSTIEEAREAAENNYCGCYSSLADYAQELTEQSTEIPQNLGFYIDYERMGRDMEMNGDVFTIEIGCNEVYIFFNH